MLPDPTAHERDRPALLVFDDPADAAAHAAQLVANTLMRRPDTVLLRKPDTVLGLATGATMLPVYERLLEAKRSCRLSNPAARSTAPHAS